MRKLLIILCITLLTACATPYQRMGASGGYSDMALSKDMYKVAFRGNGYSSQDYVQSLLLRRCAELTAQHGYKYFVIMAGNTNNDQSIVTTPTTINTNSYGNSYGGGNMYANSYGSNTFGNYSYGGTYNQNAYTTVNPGQTYSVNRYTTTVIIKMLKTNKNNPTALEADVILSNFESNT